MFREWLLMLALICVRESESDFRVRQIALFHLRQPKLIVGSFNRESGRGDLKCRRCVGDARNMLQTLTCSGNDYFG